MKTKLLRVVTVLALVATLFLNSSAIAYATNETSPPQTEPSDSSQQQPDTPSLPSWAETLGPTLGPLAFEFYDEIIVPIGDSEFYNEVLVPGWESLCDTFGPLVTEFSNTFGPFAYQLYDLFFMTDEEERQSWNDYTNDTVMDSVGWDVYLFLRNSIAVPILIVSVAGNGFVILGAAFTGGGASATSAVTKRLSTAILAFIILMILPSVFTLATDLLMKGAWDPLSVG